MEGRTKRRQKRLSVGGIWVRLAVLARRLLEGARRGAVTAWRGTLRVMPPRDAVIVVVAGGLAFGLGVALGRVTAPPAAPLDQGYVTIERVNSHETETEAPTGAGEDARFTATGLGAPATSAPVSGVSPASGGGTATGDKPAAAGSDSNRPEATGSGGQSADDDEGAGVVGPVPALGVTPASQSPPPAAASSSLPESPRSAVEEEAVRAVEPLSETAGGAGSPEAGAPSTKAAAPGGAAAKPAAPGPSAAASSVRPASPPVQAPKATTAQTSRQEKMLMPVQGRIISEFGWRKHPVFADWRYHTGIDIAASEGIPVRAALSGKVVEVKNDRQLGLYVVLEHEGGLRTKYGHLGSSPASPGDQVTQGQYIGKAGSSGVTSGCYVHFEVVRDGKAQDPKEFL